MTQELLNNTIKSASFNVIFQIFFRVISFILNAFVLRYISQDVIGVINVRLLLLESTILFLSREAFRRSALSQAESHSWCQIINLVWLTLPISVIFAIIFGLVWTYVLSVPSTTITLDYSLGVWCVCGGCIVEILAEPLYIISQAFAFIKLKIVLASLVVIIRSAIFVPWIIFNSYNAVFAFSVAQLVANFFYVVGYYSFFYIFIKYKNEKKTKDLKMGSAIISKNTTNCFEEEKKIKTANRKNFFQIFYFYFNLLRYLKHQILQSTSKDQINAFPFTSICDFFPKNIKNKDWIHPKFAYLTWAFLKQGILKQILTEGERYVMTLFSVLSFKEQGVYDVVNNLGSLIVRFLFRPVEDSLYFYFTQTIKRDAQLRDQNLEKVTEASMVLYQTLNCFVDIGLVILTFGQSYSTLLLYLYGGKSMAIGQGPTLLRAHSFSVLLLGINGVTECFAFSTMAADELDRYNYTMAGFSVFFLTISWALTKSLGGIGFIIANCCNMFARILHSVLYIRSKYSEKHILPLHKLIPTKYFFGILCFTLCVTKFTENHCNMVTHFLVGVLCFLVLALAWVLERQELLKKIIYKWRNRKLKKN